MQEGPEKEISEVRDGVTVSVQHSADMDTKWIEDGLLKKGKSKSGLAGAMGRSPSMVTALLKGERQLKASEVAIIATYLDVAPPAMIVQVEDTSKIRYARLTGEVAAGVWAEPRLEFDGVITTIPVDTKYPEGSVYVLRIRGTSINRKARDGDYVLCLDVYAAPRSYQVGDWVIAEREQNGLIETTVKRVASRSEGSWLLMPDSDDRQHQDGIIVGEVDEDVVTVKAFVLQFIHSGTIF